MVFLQKKCCPSKQEYRCNIDEQGYTKDFHVVIWFGMWRYRKIRWRLRWVTIPPDWTPWQGDGHTNAAPGAITLHFPIWRSITDLNRGSSHRQWDGNDQTSLMDQKEAAFSHWTNDIHITNAVQIRTAFPPSKFNVGAEGIEPSGWSFTDSAYARSLPFSRSFPSCHCD